MSDMFREDERRRAELARHRENKGRLAAVYATYSTVGQGTVQFDKRINFGLVFTQMPYMAYGTVIDPEALEDLLGIGPRDPLSFPQATGFVCDWDMDDRGYYVGAWVGVAVNFPTELGVPLDTQVALSHHFTFTATAMKAFGMPDDD